MTPLETFLAQLQAIKKWAIDNNDADFELSADEFIDAVTEVFRDEPEDFPQTE